MVHVGNAAVAGLGAVEFDVKEPAHGCESEMVSGEMGRIECVFVWL